jgi:ketosteroid isomerase-like protein
LIVASFAHASDPPQHWSAEQREVWNVVHAWNRAFAHNDVDAYFRFIDADVTVFTPSNPFRVFGVTSDREEFEFSLKRGASRVGYFQELDPHVAIYGGSAVVTYYSRGYYGGENGGVRYYKETDVLAKRDGAWRIVHVHVSNARE